MAEISYAKYRQERESIKFQKEKVLKIGTEKTDAHRNYRKYWNIWNDKSKQYDKEVQELLKII